MKKENNVIDVEYVEEEIEVLEPRELIKVKQAPVILFDKLEDFALQVQKQIKDLDLENIVATEDNLTEIKRTRTELRKSLTALEDSRKLTERTILRPYKEFETKYNELIKQPLSKAEKGLKSDIDKVEDALRRNKTSIFENMFDVMAEELNITFAKFEDVGLNIQLSTPETKLTTELEEFFQKIEDDLKVIETNPNKERVLALYEENLDLSKSIVQVSERIKREEELKEREAKRQAEQAERQRLFEIEKARREAEKAERNAKRKAEEERDLAIQKEIIENANYMNEVEKKIEEFEDVDLSFKGIKKEEVKIEEKEEETILSITITITGTKEEIISVREFMKEGNITYE